ncbi:MAG: ABC transporter permease [Planctomycetota bacterium]
MNGFLAILLKEFAHVRRDRSTIVFAFVIPALQLAIYGYAIDVTIDNIPLVVYDLDGRQESRRFVEAMVNTKTFSVVDRVQEEEAFRRALTSGRAKAGVLIPADYSERLLRGEQATVQVLVDGSDSQVATTAVNSVGLLAMQLSVGRAKAMGDALQVAPARNEFGELSLPIEVRTRLLFNPDLQSSHFFVPGLIAIILQLVLLVLTSFSIVRERENGTLEQLFVTPVSRGALLFGKILPYTIMACGELLLVLLLMVAVFGVPIRGDLVLLLGLSFLFILTALGLGMLISTVAKTQLEATQFSLIIMLPSILLSGFIFPRTEMPLPIYLLSYAIPVAYFIEILRGVILRGADFVDVFPSVVGLAACCVAALALSLARFRKQLD